MSRIRSRDTQPELFVRKFLYSKGYRYRINYKKLPGKPDIAFPGRKKAIFIHGCFWHGHEGCRYFVIPKSRTEWWMEKIDKNKQRDKEKIFQIEEKNWKILTIFECELRPDKREKTLKRILRFLNRY